MSVYLTKAFKHDFWDDDGLFYIPWIRRDNCNYSYQVHQDLYFSE